MFSVGWTGSFILNPFGKECWLACRVRNLVWCLTRSCLSLRVDSVCLRLSKFWEGLSKSCLRLSKFWEGLSESCTWELVCVSVDPWVDTVGSPFVRLTGSCTVPELSVVGVSGRGAPTLLHNCLATIALCCLAIQSFSRKGRWEYNRSPNYLLFLFHW